MIAARLAERMDVSPPTVADMLKRLSDKGLVKTSRRDGVKLTKKGLETAETMVRRHRLWETVPHRCPRASTGTRSMKKPARSSMP